MFLLNSLRIIKQIIMKEKLLVIGLFISFNTFAQVGIGTTTPAATTDITAQNPTGGATNVDGLLIPRVDRQRARSMVGTPTSTLIYVNNLTSTQTGQAANIDAVGFYYYDGAVWQKLNSGGVASNDWTITGNANTTMGTNFLGTTNAQGVDFRTNNTNRFRIPNGNQVYAMSNGTAALPFYSWNADSDIGMYRIGTNILGFSTTGTERIRVRADGNVGINSLGNVTDQLAVEDTDYPINAYAAGAATNHTAIYGSQTGMGSVIWGENFKAASDGSAAVFGESELTIDPGVEGRNNFGSSNSVGVYGRFNYTGNRDGTGVYGQSQPAAGWGIGVHGEGNWYGVFSSGDFGATGAKTFIIDHPLDPENKTLKHFSIESNEILNVYRGNATFDSNGNATIQLPNYFNSINKDFSYQLTPVGAAMPNLYVAEKINTNGSFVISGGVTGKEVSWSVYAQRNDKYVQENPEKIMDEIEKKDYQKGKYYDPTSWKQPKEKGIFYRKVNTNMNKKEQSKSIE